MIKVANICTSVAVTLMQMTAAAEFPHVSAEDAVQQAAFGALGSLSPVQVRRSGSFRAEHIQLFETPGLYHLQRGGGIQMLSESTHRAVAPYRPIMQTAWGLTSRREPQLSRCEAPLAPSTSD